MVASRLLGSDFVGGEMTVNRCYTSYTTSIKHALKGTQYFHRWGFSCGRGKRFNYAMCGRVFFKKRRKKTLYLFSKIFEYMWTGRYSLHWTWIIEYRRTNVCLVRMSDEVFLTWAIVAMWSELWNRRKNEHMFMAGKNKVLSVHASVLNYSNVVLSYRFA